MGGATKTPEELNALAERASAHKRRQLAPQGHSAFKLMAWVYHSPPLNDLMPGPDGWTVLAILHDAINGQDFRIWWEPATDRLQLVRNTST